MAAKFMQASALSVEPVAPDFARDIEPFEPFAAEQAGGFRRPSVLRSSIRQLRSLCRACSEF
jgi:hypothetical protein